MVNEIKSNISEDQWDNEEVIGRYLSDIVDKKAGDGSGIIYGTGHNARVKVRVVKTLSHRIY